MIWNIILRFISVGKERPIHNLFYGKSFGIVTKIRLREWERLSIFIVEKLWQGTGFL